MAIDDQKWFDQIPLDRYLEINKEYSENEPQEVPEPIKIGSLDIRCGPIVNFLGSHENGTNNYRGTILLVTRRDDENGSFPEISYTLGPAVEPSEEKLGALSEMLSEGSFEGTMFFSEEGFDFWRFKVELELAEIETRVKYYINGHHDASYQFYVPAKDESMNIISHSCNGFSLGADPKDFSSSLWYDVLEKHKDQHYHVMLGGGDQIYADSIKIKCKEIEGWLNEKNILKKYSMKPSEETLKSIGHYYLHHYLAWYGKGYWEGTHGQTCQALFPVAMSQIPSVNIYDDHDIIDGFGSYRDSTMTQEYFEAIGNIAYKYYMLFQHHMHIKEDVHNSEDAEPSWILSNNVGRYIRQRNHSVYMRLGKEIALLGVDCRTERTLKQIISPDTYSLIFARLDRELEKTPEVKHVLVMLGVPFLYPRLIWLEWLLTSPLFYPLKRLAAKGVIAKGLVNEFDADIEVLDDLNDHWCARHHKKERNFLTKKLNEHGAAHSVRMTVLSGDVHLCCIGRLRTKDKHRTSFHLVGGGDKDKSTESDNPEYDPRLIFNVTSSAIVNAPPPNPMATLLNKRSKVHHFHLHADEDIVPIFYKNPDGSERGNHRFLNKRNWADLILAKQSRYKNSLDKGLFRHPGPSGDSSQLSKEHTNKNNVNYPLSENSLVTTLHVEVDPSDYRSKTADYELLIPMLKGNFGLSEEHIKHLD